MKGHKSTCRARPAVPSLPPPPLEDMCSSYKGSHTYPATPLLGHHQHRKIQVKKKKKESVGKGKGDRREKGFLHVLRTSLAPSCWDGRVGGA